jgi:hypothetical protein
MGIPHLHDLLRGIDGTGSMVRLVEELAADGATSATAATTGSTAKPASYSRSVEMKGKFVCVDAATFVFRLCKLKEVYTQLFMETENPCPAMVLAKLLEDRLVRPLLKVLGVAGVYLVFDGALYTPKELTQRTRRGPRALALGLLEGLRTALANEHWEGEEKVLRLALETQLKEAVAPDDRVFETINAYFSDNPNVLCWRSSFEADHQCVAMQQDGLVDNIISDDSDLFGMGGDMILSNFKFKREVLEKRKKNKEAVTRDIVTAEIAEREHIFGPLWEVDTKYVTLEKGGLEYLAGNLLSQADFFAMLGTDYQPHLSGNSFADTHALFKSDVFGKNTKPDVSARKYSSPRSGELAKDYWADHKKNTTAMLAAPVFGVVAGGDGAGGNSKEAMFKLASTGLIKVTLRRLHDTGGTEADVWNSIGLSASHINQLRQNAAAVLMMKNSPSSPNNAVRAFTLADLMLAGHDLAISADCADLTRHSVSDVRNYLHLHNVDTSADCPTRTLIYIVKRVMANPEYYPLIRIDQLRRGDEASPLVLYTLADKPKWDALLDVYRFALKECELLNDAFFKRIFPKYPSILRRAIWLLTGGRIDPKNMSITRDLSLNAGVSVGDAGVGVSTTGDAGCGLGASASSSTSSGEMVLIKATVVSSYQNSKYIVTLVFVRVGVKFNFSPSCSGGECVTSSVTCAHILSVLMALRMFQLFPLNSQEKKAEQVRTHTYYFIHLQKETSTNTNNYT